MRLLISLLLVLAALLSPLAGRGAAHPRAIPHAAGGAAATRGACPAMPAVAPAGYRAVVRDDFTAPVLDARTWFRWSGEPGSDPFGWWDTPRAVAGRGALRLGGQWVSTGGNPRWRSGGEVTSGIGSRRTLRYGEYSWCMRVDDMPGTSTIALLWPAGARQWPPEIDLFETKGSTTAYSVTLHYGTARENLIVRRFVVRRDATRWHVYTATWGPGLIRVAEDGSVVATISGNPHVPSVPMRFDIQTQAVRHHPVLGTTTVGWVVEYARTR